MLALDVVCFLMLTYYNFKGTFKRTNQVKFSKSHRSSNRWLKGKFYEVLCSLFGYGNLFLIFQCFSVLFVCTSKIRALFATGVISLFGLAIVLKDGLEFLSGLLTASPTCPDSQLLVAVSFFNAAFIISEVKYLYRFSKVYIRNSSAGSR